MPSLTSLEAQARKTLEAYEAIKRQTDRDEALDSFRNALIEKIGIAAAEGYAKLVGSKHRVFKDPLLLRPLSDPPNMRIAVRKHSMATLRSLLLENIRSQAASCIFIFGGPGTGKTVCVRAALSELTNLLRTRKIEAHAVYVNAGQTRSPYYTMLEIVRQMGVEAAPSGWQFARLKFEFERARDAKPTVIAVDEVDSLLYKEREPLVYYLNRQPYVTLVLISNNFSDLANLPARAKSSLQPIPLVFYPYNAQQAHEILNERTKHAFKPGAVPRDVLQAAAKAAEKAGDIRFGFNLLLLAGLSSEASRRSKVSIKDLNSFLPGLNEIFTTS